MPSKKTPGTPRAEAVARLSVDPIGLEIMWARLITIVEECWQTVCRTAFGHVSDIGGNDSLRAREICEEGIQIPPMMLFREGRPTRICWRCSPRLCATRTRCSAICTR